jgi:NADH-quinone oxidoreductase subunit M
MLSAIDLLWLFPFAAAALVLRAKPELARKISLLVSLASTLAALSLFASTLSLDGPQLRLDGPSLLLLPLVTMTISAVLIAAPRWELDARTLSGLLVLLGATVGALCTSNVLQIAVFWAISLIPLQRSVVHTADRPLQRAVHVAMALCIVPLGFALGAMVFHGWREGLASPWDLAVLRAAGAGKLRDLLGFCVLLSVCVRMGVVPVHMWLPFVLQRAPLAIAIPTVLSPLGTYVLVRVGFQLFPGMYSAISGVMLPLGALSSIYGALLVLGQHDSRRQAGFFVVSAMGAVIAGLFAQEEHGVSGALLYHAAILVCVLGLLLIVWGIEARLGRSDQRRLGSLVRATPRMATAFFLLSAAAVGFPGTATFVSEDLLVQGVLHDHPAVTTVLLLATALNGVSLIRAFKRIFLGAPTVHSPDTRRLDDLRPGERGATVMLVVALIVTGLIPAPLVLAVRSSVAATLVHARDAD